ncbi:MAG TPA: class I SAM-dependent methyltransferase [Bacillota bacterium]|nr:class I SAM-dependent methyltransferase [Bacillota bacterium]
MLQLLDYAKSFITSAVPENGTVADFTMGNGHDTLFLCRLVPEGKVYAFDIQQQALNNTKKLLDESGVTNAILIKDSHANAAEYIDGPIDAGMFNLGWLPGGDKSIHTLRESTLKAVDSAVAMLREGGIITVSVYPGHSEGTTEGDLLTEKLSTLDKLHYCVSYLRLINSPDAPYVIAIEKYKKKK